MTKQKIEILKKKYYALLYAQKPAFKILGHIQFDLAWDIIEEVLRNEKD